MNTKVSKNFIKSNFEKRIYLDDLTLIKYVLNESKFYGGGLYGWNWSCYPYGYEVCFLNGYRDIPYNIRSHKIEEKYKKILQTYKENEYYNKKSKNYYNYEALQENARKILDDFVNEIVTENDNFINEIVKEATTK